MLNAKRSVGVRPISVTSLANPMALKTKKTPSRNRKKDLGESVFQNDLALLIKSVRFRASYHSEPIAWQRSIVVEKALPASLSNSPAKLT